MTIEACRRAQQAPHILEVLRTLRQQLRRDQVFDRDQGNAHPGDLHCAGAAHEQLFDARPGEDDVDVPARRDVLHRQHPGLGDETGVRDLEREAGLLERGDKPGDRRRAEHHGDVDIGRGPRHAIRRDGLSAEDVPRDAQAARDTLEGAQQLSDAARGTDESSRRGGIRPCARGSRRGAGGLRGPLHDLPPWATPGAARGRCRGAAAGCAARQVGCPAAARARDRGHEAARTAPSRGRRRLVSTRRGMSLPRS